MHHMAETRVWCAYSTKAGGFFVGYAAVAAVAIYNATEGSRPVCGRRGHCSLRGSNDRTGVPCGHPSHRGLVILIINGRCPLGRIDAMRPEQSVADLKKMRESRQSASGL
jgi:hypothetical protein